MKEKIAQGATAVLLTVALAGAAVAPALATDEGTIEETHTYMSSAGDTSPAPDNIERDGVAYQLVTTYEQPDPTFVPEKTHVSWTETKTCEAWELEDAKASMPKKWNYDKDGVKGKIARKSLDVEEIYGDVPKTYTSSITRSGLEVKDESAVPKTHTVTFDSGVTRTLNRTGVSWSKDKKKESWHTQTYSFVATYALTEMQSGVTGYKITATYEGDLPISADDERMQVIATYEPVVEPEDAFPMAAAAAAAAAVAAGGVLSGLFFWRRRKKNVCVVYLQDDEQIEVTRVVAKRDESGIYTCQIPASVDVKGHQAALVLRPELVGDPQGIQAYQGQELIYAGPAEALCEIPRN